MDGVPSRRRVVDLDPDRLAHYTTNVSLQDLSNMAMTCKFFRTVAYSDSVWRHRFRQRWPTQYTSSGFSQTSGVREAYLARCTALQQFKFLDPLDVYVHFLPIPYGHMLLDKNHLILAQGSEVHRLTISDSAAPLAMRGFEIFNHNARITCMRLFPLKDTFLFRSAMQNDENILITSSWDRTIQLWWKGHSQRCFKGHCSTVTCLADKLLGGCNGKFLASGGEDGTVQLWSLTSSAKRGHQLSVATLYGHERSVTLLSVAGHNPSLLVSVSRDAKVMVWDATASATRSSFSVGRASVNGLPVGIKCDEALCYISSGSLVTVIDLRTMRKVSTAAIHPPKIYTFQLLPSKSLICTGGDDRAMLWDIRKNQEKPEPVADLDGHTGHVAHLHMDQYKIVTGGPEDPNVKIWDTDTGALANSLRCLQPDEPGARIGLSAMAVDGCRIVTSSCGDESGYVRYRDFTHATRPLSANECNPSSMFWEPEAPIGYDD